MENIQLATDSAGNYDHHEGKLINPVTAVEIGSNIARTNPENSQKSNGLFSQNTQSFVYGRDSERPICRLVSFASAANNPQSSPPNIPLPVPEPLSVKSCKDLFPHLLSNSKASSLETSANMPHIHRKHSNVDHHHGVSHSGPLDMANTTHLWNHTRIGNLPGGYCNNFDSNWFPGFPLHSDPIATDLIEDFKTEAALGSPWINSPSNTVNQSLRVKDSAPSHPVFFLQPVFGGDSVPPEGFSFRSRPTAAIEAQSLLSHEVCDVPSY